MDFIIGVVAFIWPIMVLVFSQKLRNQKNNEGALPNDSAGALSISLQKNLQSAAAHPVTVQYGQAHRCRVPLVTESAQLSYFLSGVSKWLGGGGGWQMYEGLVNPFIAGKQIKYGHLHRMNVMYQKGLNNKNFICHTREWSERDWNRKREMARKQCCQPRLFLAVWVTVLLEEGKDI